MHKLLSFLVISVMSSGVVFAQVNTDALSASREAFWKQIDTTTEWGSWLVIEVKPYLDKMSEAMVTTTLPTTQIDVTGLSPEEILKKVNAGFVDYYKAMQNIIPPTELKAYHTKILEFYAEVTKVIPANHQQALQSDAIMKKLVDEATQDLAQVFIRHGVPQDIIAEFTKIP